MVAKPAHVENADDVAVARPVEAAVVQQQTAAALTTPESTVAYQQMQGTTSTDGWLNNNLTLVDEKAGKGKPTDSTTQTLSTDPSETPEPPPPEYYSYNNADKGTVILASDDSYPTQTAEPPPPENA